MIKEYCEKNSYDIVDVYNDAGHSGKDLMRLEMQRLLKDIKSHKIEVIVAINFANYPYIIFVSSKIMEMDSSQQNKIALYLFNSINFNTKKCKSLDS